MSETNLWWLLAGAAIATELVSGTFYLLMLATGLVAGALASTFGMALVGQMLVAAAVGGGAVTFWHWRRSRSPAPLAAYANPDVHLDIGEAVNVPHWNADGTASVHFRGARWTAVSADPGGVLHPGNHRIQKMQGNRLVLEKL